MDISVSIFHVPARCPPASPLVIWWQETKSASWPSTDLLSLETWQQSWLPPLIPMAEISVNSCTCLLPAPRWNLSLLSLYLPPPFFFSPLQLFFIHQVKFPPMFLRETFAPLSLGCQRLQEERSPCAAVGKWRKYWSLGRAVKDCRTWLSAVWTSCRKQDWNQEMIQRQFVTSRKAATSLYIKTWEKTLWSLFCQLSLLVCSF